MSGFLEASWRSRGTRPRARFRSSCHPFQSRLPQDGFTLTRMDQLDAAAKAMIDATNRGDSDAVVASFTSDAVLNDWGRLFNGRDEIGRWDRDENTGSHNQIKVTSVAHRGDAVKVGITVSGGGFNGEGTFVFEFEDGLISRLNIT
jgi:hypothetical protein